MELVRALGEVVARQVLLGLLVGSVLLVGLSLQYGTDALLWLGLSRVVAASIVTVIVVTACLAGLGAFAVYGIDWE